MDLSIIGKLIKIERTKRNISQAALAEKTGVSDKKTISEWENGSTIPKLVNIVALAEALGCDPEHLLGYVPLKTVTTSWIAEQIPLTEKTIDALRGLKKECDKRDEFNALDDETHMTQYLTDAVIQRCVLDSWNSGANETLMTLAYGLLGALKILAEYPDGVKMVDDDFLYGKETNPLDDEMRLNPPERYRMAKWEKEQYLKNIGELLAESICNKLEELLV